jgi:hypothetical protein
MPWSILKAKVMQATTRFHDGVANAILEETDLVFHDPIAFHTANSMFDTNSDRRDTTIGRLLRGCEFPPTGSFLRLDEADTVQDKTLEPHILVEATAEWQAIALQIRDAFIMHLAFRRGTQEANVTALIHHEQVFARVALLLAAIMVLLFLWILWAVDGSFSTIMPKRGGWGRPWSVCSPGASLTRQPCGPATVPAALRPDSTPDGGDAATYWYSIETSQRVVLALLGWDSV